jgi:glycosyltransferase involved in cell wall biosynthesis
VKIFYLGFWLPPSLVHRYPQQNGAGQWWESRLLRSLNRGSELRIASVVDRKLDLVDAEGQNPGHLLLQGRFGKDLQSYPSFLKLRQTYLHWRRQGWKPDHFVVYNSHPVGNAFARFVAKYDPDIKRILLFLDSKYFGKKLKLFKRLRLRFKPLHWRDEEMLPYFHGVAAASLSSQWFCQDRGIPWHWFPGGAKADGLLDKVLSPEPEGTKQIGYFGSHADYAGLRELLEAFKTKADLPLKLSIAGEGEKTEELRQYAASDPRIEWMGFFNDRADLGRWASSCHVFVNPRPPRYGNDNNFPSKIFDYMQLGRPVLSSTTPTLKHAFGDAMTWYDAENPRALSQALAGIAQRSVADLLGEGEALRGKYCPIYSWGETVHNLEKWMAKI